MLDEKYLTIIDKHIGEKLFAVYSMNGEIRTRYGKLTETYSGKFTLHDIASDKSIKINYYKDGDNFTIGLYNFYCVDLMRGKTPMNLQAKMDLSTISKSILPRIKEAQNNEIHLIVFDVGKFRKIDGVLDDIGMRDVIISNGRNSTLTDRVPYSQIIHIFDENCIDIIAS